MGWVKLDDGFGEHPKIARLSDSALALWVASLAYANRNLTDGFIPESVGFGQLRYSGGNTVPFVAELEEIGLWETVEGGWQVHDYLDFQRSRVEILGERESVRDRVQRHRDAVSNEESNAVTTAVPLGLGEVGVRGSGGKGDFEKFYSAFPRHIGRRAAERAWVSAIKRADPADIIAGAERLAADPNLPETRFVPHPSTWLNRDGWTDDAHPSRNGRTSTTPAMPYHEEFCFRCRESHRPGEHTAQEEP